MSSIKCRIILFPFSLKSRFPELLSSFWAAYTRKVTCICSRLYPFRVIINDKYYVLFVFDFIPISNTKLNGIQKPWFYYTCARLHLYKICSQIVCVYVWFDSLPHFLTFFFVLCFLLLFVVLLNTIAIQCLSCDSCELLLIK